MQNLKEVQYLMQSTYDQRRGVLFLFLVLLFVFQDPMQTIFPPLKYLDELFAFLLVPLFFLRLIHTDFQYVFTQRQLLMFFLLVVFWLSGYIGFFLNQYQPLGNTISDSCVGVKFFMAIGSSFLLFENSNFKEVEKLAWKVLNIVTTVLFLLCLADLVLHIFPGEIRFGVKSVRLFYSTYTILAAQCIFICAIYLRLYEQFGTRVVPRMGMLCFVTICTLRMKAIGGVLCIFFIFMIICRKRRQIGFLTWSTIGAGVLLVAAKQFFYYFGTLRNESARALLTERSITIAADYFPYGTGWGTFGSAFSIEPYSPVYRLYHLNRVWGLSPTYSSFVSDTFWPMLLGECGVLGVLLYVIVLILLAKSIFALGKQNAYALAAGLATLLYLLLSSTSESAFVHTIAIPFAFWLGFLFAEDKKEGQYLCDKAR